MIRSQHQLKRRPGQEAGTKPKNSVWTPFKNCIIGIPKNLIRIFMLVVLISFGYMIYLVTNEELNLEFLSSEVGERDYSMTRVHPLFQYL